MTPRRPVFVIAIASMAWLFVAAPGWTQQPARRIHDRGPTASGQGPAQQTGKLQQLSRKLKQRLFQPPANPNINVEADQRLRNSSTINRGHGSMFADLPLSQRQRIQQAQQIAPQSNSGGVQATAFQQQIDQGGHESSHAMSQNGQSFHAGSASQAEMGHPPSITNQGTPMSSWSDYPQQQEFQSVSPPSRSHANHLRPSVPAANGMQYGTGSQHSIGPGTIPAGPEPLWQTDPRFQHYSSRIPASERLLLVEQEMTQMQQQYQGLQRTNQSLRNELQENRQLMDEVNESIDTAVTQLQEAQRTNQQLRDRIAELEELNRTQKEQSSRMLDEIRKQLDGLLAGEISNVESGGNR